MLNQKLLDSRPRSYEYSTHSIFSHKVDFLNGFQKGYSQAIQDMWKEIDDWPTIEAETRPRAISAPRLRNPNQ